MSFFTRLLSVVALLFGLSGAAAAQSDKTLEQLHDALTTCVDTIPDVLLMRLDTVNIYIRALTALAGWVPSQCLASRSASG